MKIRTPAYLIIVSIVFLFFVLQMLGVTRLIGDVGHVVLIPIIRVLSFVGFETSKRTADVEDVNVLKEKTRDLEARLSTMSVDYVRLKALEEENASLKASASFLSSSGYDHVGARIIARSTDPQVASMLIDRGSRDGLEIGMAVISGDGVFVGKIAFLQRNVSTVLLIADHRSRVAVARSGTKKLFGVIEGQGNGVGKLTLVPQNEPLQRDDIIMTAGTEDKVPGNLAVGLVNDVQGHPTDPFKTATIEPLARPETLNLVVVLRPDALRPTGAN
jgi:rod shape-determining protein MreC